MWTSASVKSSQSPVACDAARRAGMAFSEPAGRQFIDTEYGQPRIVFFRGGKNPGRVVGRTVIDDDDVQLDRLLREQPLERLADPCLFVLRGDDYGHARSSWRLPRRRRAVGEGIRLPQRSTAADRAAKPD